MKRKIEDLWCFFKKIYNISPSRINWIFVIAIADAINIYLTTYFFKFVIDTVIRKESFQKVLFWVVVRLGFLLIYQCMDNILHTVVFPKLENKIRKELTSELYNKISILDMDVCEDAEKYDKVSRAIHETENRAIGLLGTIRGLLSTTSQTIVLLFSLIILSPMSIAISLLGVLISFWGNVVNSKKVYLYDKKKTRLNRKIDYVKRIFSLPEYRQDIHLSFLGKRLVKYYGYNIKEMNEVISAEAPPLLL